MITRIPTSDKVTLGPEPYVMPRVSRRLSLGGSGCMRRRSKLSRAGYNTGARRAGDLHSGRQGAIGRGGRQLFGDLWIGLERLCLSVMLRRAAIVTRMGQLVGIIDGGRIEQRGGIVKIGGNQVQLLQNFHRLPPIETPKALGGQV